MPRELTAAKRPLDARLRAPASKSVTHRALVAAALADGTSMIAAALDADDTRATAAALRALGAGVEWGDVVRVEGFAGRPGGGSAIDLGESGTSMRLLTAVAALGDRPTAIDGAARLRQRPLAPLVEALRSLGADISQRALPLTVGGTPLAGGEVVVPGSAGSQFASAMLLLGPCIRGGLVLRIAAPARSLPYVDLTVAVMREFGAAVERLEPLAWKVVQGRYRARTYTVEGDHSSASYFLAAALVAGGRVRVANLESASDQADARTPRLLTALGAKVRYGDGWIEATGDGRVRAFELDLGDCPDLVPTFAVLAAFADGTSRIRNVPHLRAKESDRLEQLARNLRRLGSTVVVRKNGLEITAAEGDRRAATIETAGDHRIAMAFAIAGLRLPGLVLDDARCVSKSYPDFWKDWDRMLF